MKKHLIRYSSSGATCGLEGYGGCVPLTWSIKPSTTEGAREERLSRWEIKLCRCNFERQLPGCRRDYWRGGHGGGRGSLSRQYPVGGEKGRDSSQRAGGMAAPPRPTPTKATRNSVGHFAPPRRKGTFIYEYICTGGGSKADDRTDK